VRAVGLFTFGLNSRRQIAHIFHETMPDCKYCRSVMSNLEPPVATADADVVLGEDVHLDPADGVHLAWAEDVGDVWSRRRNLIRLSGQTI